MAKRIEAHCPVTLNKKRGPEGPRFAFLVSELITRPSPTAG